MSGSKAFDTAHDFPPMSEPSGKPILEFDPENPLHFTDLLDTFNDYTGLGGYFLMVRATEDGITTSAVAVESDKNYVHIQSTDATEWLVKHNLKKYPAVMVLNTSDRIVTAEVQYIDTNSLYIRSDIAFSGKAVCN